MCALMIVHTIFRGTYAALKECPVCNAQRYKRNMIHCRRFHYLTIGPRLERLFGTTNLAQLVQAHIDRSDTCTTDSVLSDIHSSPAWAATYSKDGVFKGDARGIAFGLCIDGVNPFSHLRTSYSMIPIVLSLLKLPRNMRHSLVISF